MSTTPQKPLNLFGLTTLVVGNMIGSGIFLLPANLASLGDTSLLAWILTVCGTFILAILLSKNSQWIPKDGGPYAYAKVTLGEFTGFQTAYLHWIGMWVANIALIIAMIGYLAHFWPLLTNSHVAVAVAILCTWLGTASNIFGARLTNKIQISTTVLKIIPILLIIIFGWKHFHAQYVLEDFNLPNIKINYSVFSASASLTLWAFIGVESACIPYSLVENPKRTIPLATLIGVGIASLVYVLSSVVIMGMIPTALLAKTAMPFAAAAEIMFGHVGKWVIFAAAAVSCLGCLNGWIFLQGQLAMAAAKDNLFPKLFGMQNKFQTPSWGLFMTSFLISIILLLLLNKEFVKQFHLVVAMASFASLVPYFYAAIAAMIILKRCPEAVASNRARIIYSLLALLGTLYAFWAICSIGSMMITYGAILIFASTLLYAWKEE